MPLNVRLTVDQLQLLTDEFISRNHALAETTARLSQRHSSARADIGDLTVNVAAGMIGGSLSGQERGVLERRLNALTTQMQGTDTVIGVFNSYLNSIQTLLHQFETRAPAAPGSRTAERIRKTAILELVERFSYNDLKVEEVVAVVKAATARSADEQSVTEAETANEELRYVGILVKQIMTGRE